MMGVEEAGTIAAQIRLELDQLERDGLQAQKMMDHYAREFKKEGEKGGKEYVKGFGKGQLELNKKLNEMVSTFQGISPKMGVFGDKLAHVFSKPIFAMIPQVSMAFQAMLPVIGTIIAAVAAIAMGVKKGMAAWKEQSKQIDASKEAARRLNGSYKEAEKSLSGQVKLGDKLRVAFQPIIGLIASIGAGIADGYKEFLKWATLIGLILNNIEKIQAGFATLFAIIKGDKRSLSEIFNEQLKIVQAKAEEVAEARILAEQVSATNTAEAQYKQTLKEIATAKRVFNKSEKESAAEQLAALESLTAELIKQREIAVDKAGKDAGLVKNIEARLQLLKKEKERLEEITKETEKSDQEKITEARMAAINRYEQAVRIANDAKKAGLIDELEYQKQIESALATEYADMETIVAQYKLSTGETIRQRDELAKIVKLNQDNAKAQADIQKIEDATNAAIIKRAQAEKIAQDAKAKGLIDEEQYNQQIEAALAREYADLEAIVVQYELINGEAVRLRNELAGQVKNNQDILKAKELQQKINGIVTGQGDTLKQQEIDRAYAAAESAQSEAEKNRLLDEAIALENQLIVLQRARARETLIQSEEFKSASEDVRKSILLDFAKITEAMLKMRELAGAEDTDFDFWEFIGISREKGEMGMQIGQAAISTFDNISNAALEISRQHAEEQIAIIDAALKRFSEQLEAAREAELEAAGFIQARSEEEFDKQITTAKEAGDEVLQYQIQRRKQEMEINKKYNEQLKAAEEQAARERADIEYRSAVANYFMQMIQAVNNGAMAILNAISTPGIPWPVAAAFGISAGAAASIQIGMLAANPPKPPKFADGGIIPGRKSEGDTQHILATAGELILNEAQQRTIAGKLDTRGDTTVYLSVYLDSDSGEAIAKSVIRYANATGAVLEQRAIRGMR
jgi:hypothetical protein